jgi:hypothetical protein
VVTTTQDMMGGEWEQDWRHLKVMADAFIHGREVIYRLSALEHPAKAVDRALTDGGLMALDHAAKKLEQAVVIHARAVEELRREVGYLVAAVVQARVLKAGRPNDPSPEEEYERETERLLAASDIGLDRVAKLYGLDHRPTR